MRNKIVWKISKKRATTSEWKQLKLWSDQKLICAFCAISNKWNQFEFSNLWIFSVVCESNRRFWCVCVCATGGARSVPVVCPHRTMSQMEASDGEMVVDNDDSVNVSESTNRCVHLTLRILFSTPGLCVLVVLYSLMGAAIFPFFEAPELHNTLAVIKSREECLRELWTITGKYRSNIRKWQTKKNIAFNIFFISRA